MKSTSQTWAYAAVITCIAAVCLGWILLPRINRSIEKGKAENVALNSDPFVVTRAVMSYIKRTGSPPLTASDCVSIDHEGTQQMNRTNKRRDYEFLVVEWPPNQSDVVLRSVFERIVLSFPKHPDTLIVQNDTLVLRETREPVQLIAIEGINQAERPGLRRANVELWKAWSQLVNGELTGIDWLDSYEPESPP